MLSIPLRVLLIAGSLLTMFFMLYRIRISKVQIRDAIFWILFSLMLLILSIFPEIAMWLSRLFSIQSPINLVLLVIIFALLIQLFSQNMRISKMDVQIKKLAQRIAIDEQDKE